MTFVLLNSREQHKALYNSNNCPFKNNTIYNILLRKKKVAFIYSSTCKNTWQYTQLKLRKRKTTLHKQQQLNSWSGAVLAVGFKWSFHAFQQNFGVFCFV